MSVLRLFRIGSSMGLLMGVFVLLILGVSAVGLTQLNRTEAVAAELADHWLARTQALGEVRSAGDRVWDAAMRQLLAVEEQERSTLAHQQHREWAEHVFPAALARYEQHVSSPRERQLYDDIQRRWAAYRSSEQRMLALSAGHAGQRDEARSLAHGASHAAFLVFADALDADVVFNANAARAARDAVTRTAAEGKVTAAWVFVVAVVVGVALALGFTEVAKRNARVAAAARRQASPTAGSGKRDAQLVADVVATMDKISEASGRIADIITTVDSIAFQSNVLALNAAVEAARAGDQRQGSAVVADDVLGLSRRSAESAGAARALIGDAEERLDAVIPREQVPGGTVADIVGSVENVAVLVAGASMPASRPAPGGEAVHGVVNEIDLMTLRHSALVAQSAASAESLRVLTERLRAAVAILHT